MTVHKLSVTIPIQYSLTGLIINFKIICHEKRNLKSLILNKKSIVNFQSVKGGVDSDSNLIVSLLSSCLRCDEQEPLDASTFPEMSSWHNSVCEGCL